ncbi:S-layer homology domain-containing protein [Megasphaera elsdenii]|uniref:S-layer homology domain-containing protein n=1 Tax=Megasphaera elsdenii TaxID=907 RepID=UPI00266F5E4D|nr:S-layer homology domain-containing protein [Megasphaera elsdenii]
MTTADGHLEYKVDVNDELKDIKSIIGAGEGAGSISFADGGIKINNKVTINKDGKITGVAAGAMTETSTDAVNGSQLHAVATEAGKHTTLSNGKNTTVESTVKDGQTDYKVNVAGDLTDITSVANGDSKINLNKDSIIISNGNKYFAITNSGIGMSYIGADYSAKSIMLGENGTTISGGLNVAGSKITGVAAGEADTDAVNVSQLQKVSDTANAGWNLSTNGVATEATNVKPDDSVDFSGDKNISVSHDGTKVQVELNKNIDVNYVQTNALNSKYNLSVGTMAENGIMPFLVNSTGAFYAANNNFSVDKDGKVTATAGEIGNVVLKNGVYTGNSALRDGELYVGDADGNYSQITPKSAKLGQVTIDEKGNMAGVNSIQTNALNSKYNLSVGTMAENGIMPFLVNSTGAFYAANNNFSVDKDGKVTATAGEIGNVVLKNGVYTGNSALRDGELYVGDADGNYSQITTKGAKLGQVTIAADGKISGVAAGEADTDAVNVSQLKKVSDTANAGWNLSTNGVATEATNVKPGDSVDFSGDKNISVSHDGTKVQVELNKNIDVNYVQTNALNSKYNLSVGTMAENGIMPFLVNSTGAFYAANNNFSVDKDGKVTATAGEIGNVVLKNGVYTGNSALRDGELYVGDADGNYSQITTKGAKLGKVTVAEDGKISGVAAGVADTDAVNVGQLKEAVQAGNTDTHIKPGEYGVGADNKVNMDVVDKNGNKVDTVTIKDVAKASDVGNVNNIASDIKNQDGSHTTVVDAVNNLNQKLDNKVGDLNYVEGGKGNYVTNGENTTTSIGKLDQALKDVAATAAKHTTVTQGDNITVTPGTNTDGSKNYNVALKKDITVESVTANTFKADQTVMNKDGLKVGNKVSVSATAVTAGKTSISDEGVKVGDKTYISDKGLNANEQKVTNVDAGELSATSKDAVNGSQLYETNQAIANNATNISSLSHSISNLDNRVNKVGAGAAALAALHPLDFDPDAKWDFAAGYGNYRGANAAAVGAYYRPNEDTMFSVGGTFGNGENMVNAGVSFKLGSGSSHVSTSRVAMAKEIKELRGELEAMKSAMLDANAGKKIDTSKLQLFPDVPQNHWAYEYVAQLAGNGMIEGYPDGNFAGDRPMTRYEFAAILYRAMTKGAVLSDKILSEFSHELEYFTVDTIAKDKAGNPTIQRVRTVKENKNK